MIIIFKLLIDKKNNKNFKGIYVWSLLGGWDLANNITFFSKEGFWIEIDNWLMPGMISNEKNDVNQNIKDYLAKNLYFRLNQLIFDFLKKFFSNY